MKRRSFCTAVLGGGLAAGLAANLSLFASPLFGASQAGGAAPDLVAVQGSDAVTMLEKGLAEFGGLESFIKPGQSVRSKPNMGWAVAPERGANTNPLLVRRLVELCRKAGAGRVSCFDNTCDHWRDAYEVSGIADAARAAGATVAPPNNDADYRPCEITGASTLRRARVHELYMDADVIINVPVLKNHGGAGMTAAMKNLMGVVLDRRFYHGNGLDACIAEFTMLPKKPALNIVEACRVMTSGGPRGYGDSRYKKLDMLMLSRDIVAVDAASALALGLKPEDVPYIGLGAKHGVGKGSLEGLDLRRIRA